MLLVKARPPVDTLKPNATMATEKVSGHGHASASPPAFAPCKSSPVISPGRSSPPRHKTKHAHTHTHTHTRARARACAHTHSTYAHTHTRTPPTRTPRALDVCFHARCPAQILEAAKSGNVDNLRALVASSPQGINAKDEVSRATQAAPWAGGGGRCRGAWRAGGEGSDSGRALPEPVRGQAGL